MELQNVSEGRNKKNRHFKGPKQHISSVASCSSIDVSIFSQKEANSYLPGEEEEEEEEDDDDDEYESRSWRR